MKNIIELNKANFEQEVTQANLPVLVDFYATWCGPCKMLAPVLEALASEFIGKIKFAKVNIDDASELAMQYEITGVPTLIIFKGKVILDTIVGMGRPQALKARLDAIAAQTAGVNTA